MSPTTGQIPTRYSPVRHSTRPRRDFRVRLACVKHAASVQSEPGSNSSVQYFRSARANLILARLASSESKMLRRSLWPSQSSTEHPHKLPELIVKELQSPPAERTTILYPTSLLSTPLAVSSPYDPPNSTAPSAEPRIIRTAIQRSRGKSHSTATDKEMGPAPRVERHGKTTPHRRQGCSGRGAERPDAPPGSA